MQLDKLVYAFILSNYITRTVVKWLAIGSIKVGGNKKRAETFCDGELALQAGLGTYEDMFSKKLYFLFLYGARL